MAETLTQSTSAKMDFATKAARSKGEMNLVLEESIHAHIMKEIAAMKEANITQARLR